MERQKSTEKLWKKISFLDIEGVRIGNAQDYNAMTGVTVVIFDTPNIGGIDISGGGPASRETTLLSPLTSEHTINAVVLSGGSAFGLEASTGVVKYLEERDMGYNTIYSTIPLVCQSCIYDLGIGSKKIRPDANMGYAACLDAESNNPISGIIGAGTGATAGKAAGMSRATKTGIGYYAAQIGELYIAAIAVVNAFGDVFDCQSGEKIAGLMNENRTAFTSSVMEMYHNTPVSIYSMNTTLGVIITNGKFNQAEMNKIASMTRAAYGRCINPVGTMADGDMIYAFSNGNVAADLNMTGTFAASVMEEAIRDAVLSSKMTEEDYKTKCL